MDKRWQIETLVDNILVDARSISHIKWKVIHMEGNVCADWIVRQARNGMLLDN